MKHTFLAIIFAIFQHISKSACFTQTYYHDLITRKTSKSRMSAKGVGIPEYSNEKNEKIISKSAKEAMERTKNQLKKMATQSPNYNESDPFHIERQQLYQMYILEPANSLKTKLDALNLNSKGRKPELANRMAQHSLEQKYPEIFCIQDEGRGESKTDDEKGQMELDVPAENSSNVLTSFSSINPLSLNAGRALGAAQIHEPTRIQFKAIPKISQGESVILHAETGSGKTLAYLLPITEYLQRSATLKQDDGNPESHEPILLLLTPSRELASQVAGVAEVLAPEGCVRLVTEPTDLSDDQGRGQIEKGEVDKFGGRRELESLKRGKKVGKIIIGSAKSIMISLYGSSKLPASPTPKPAAKTFLRNVKWLVLDEVDRLLSVPKTRQDRKKFSSKQHEKPAAILTAAISRLTLSRVQIIACSATVGRPLRRELARVMGLPSQESPDIVRAESDGIARKEADDAHIGRFVTIPNTVSHYVLPCDGSSSGSLLTTASFAAKKLTVQDKKILLVLTNGCGLSTRDTIGALRHLNAHLNPRSLADALEGRDSEGSQYISGTDKLIQTHREISGSVGVGESLKEQGGYLLVTVEDSCRGLHLDQLDLVIVVGRPRGPDEYTHIAGRTGRAGRIGGKVLNVVSYEQAAALSSWEKMLNVEFLPIDMEEVEQEML